MSVPVFRVFVAFILITAVAVAAFAPGFTPAAAICFLVSSGGALWIAYWLPEAILYMQDQYGMKL